MTISGFTMVKNAEKLYYPLKESILSILPIVDEFVIALGDCDADDNTLNIILSIDSPKIKIINTKWDTVTYPKGSELAHQTDIAKSNCTGDWLFYLQADEVIHENDLATILEKCKEHINNTAIDGLLFNYLHFWGDYNHAFSHNHSWYRHEIRIVRNKPEIHSWRDAQSFRKINNFNKEMYLESIGTSKLNVAMANATVYHYGWVRPPLLMARKQQRFSSCYVGAQLEDSQIDLTKVIDYGRMDYAPTFKGSHPRVMEIKIAEFNWGNQLNYTKKTIKDSKIPKHERLKYRFLTAFERLFFREFGLFTFKNFVLKK
jgi:hypothetical protein